MKWRNHAGIHTSLRGLEEGSWEQLFVPYSKYYSKITTFFCNSLREKEIDRQKRRQSDLVVSEGDEAIRIAWRKAGVMGSIMSSVGDLVVVAGQQFGMSTQWTRMCLCDAFHFPVINQTHCWCCQPLWAAAAAAALATRVAWHFGRSQTMPECWTEKYGTIFRPRSTHSFGNRACTRPHMREKLQ